MRLLLRRWNLWIVGTCLLAALVLTPLLLIVVQLFYPGEGSLWQTLGTPTVRHYLANTLMLFAGVSFGVLLLGVTTAWLVTVYDFPGRRWFSELLILPLVIPTYILAFTYAGMMEHTGPIESQLRAWWGPASQGAYLPFSLKNVYGLIFLFSVNLYPYVFMVSRASFARQSQGVLDVSRNLGVNMWHTVWRVVLPLARPAIVAGVTLCLLEVVNDYGAAEYFGVDTFATAIFREWFARDNATLAVRLAALLMLVVALLMLAERWQRGSARYDDVGKSTRPVLRQSLTGWRSWFAVLFCGFPLCFGFALPMIQLVHWAIVHGSKVAQDPSFVSAILHSLWLSGTAAVVTVGAALFLAYTLRLFPSIWMNRLSQITLIGYSVPGTIIAVGMMLLAASYDRWSKAVLASISIVSPWLLSGSFALMVAAFLVRFLMVAYSPIDASFQRHGRSLHEASRLLGHPPWRTLWLIELPLLWHGLLAAMLLVFIDALKELPLTLFLRWGNFNTLATEVYNVAKQMESVEQSAVYAVMIALAGLLPVFLLNRMLTPQHSQQTTQNQRQ